MDILIPIWFAAPWAIFMIKVIRATAYERRAGLITGLNPLDFPELMLRIEIRRKADPAYNEIKTDVYKWLKITIVWWVVSIAAIGAGLATLYLFYAGA